MTDQLRVGITLEQCWHRVPGGTATSIIELSRALADRSELDLIGISARHRSPPPGEFTPPIDVRAMALPRPILYESWHALRWPSVEQATGKIDVVHATAVAVPPSRAPLVVTIHDLAFLEERDRATRHGHRFFRRGLELARRHAALILCPSGATMRACVASGFDPDRLRLVPWGVRADEVSPSRLAEVRQRHGLRRPYVLSVGTAEPRKNLAVVVDAFRSLGDRDLDLVLVGPHGWNEDLAARTEPLGGRARALGFVSPDDLAALYAACAAFCYPSLNEGFGLPVLEAMAHGAPVVTSAGTAMEEVTGDAAALVDPRDPTAVTAALARVLDESAYAADLRTRGQARAATFTWERSAEAAAAAYAEVAGRSGSGRRRHRRSVRSPDPTSVSRIGVNLLWLVPGVVGGSEEYTTRMLSGLAGQPITDLRLTLFVLEPFAAAHPDLVAAYSTVSVGLDGSQKLSRVIAENTWLAQQARRRMVDVMHHAGGVIPPVRSTPAVLTIHDLQPLVLPDNFSPVKRRYLAAMLPRSARAARLIITPSDQVGRDVIERLGVDPDRVRTVPHGIAPVGPEPTDHDRTTVRARHGLGPTQRFFVYPAITYAHKNHAVLVDGFAQVAAADADVALVLPGGSAQAERPLLDRIAAVGLTGRVLRLGRIPRADLDVLLAEATALTFPSVFEGFGAPVLEAMAHGCPVLAARATALPEIVGTAGVLVDPYDAAEWARAMTMMLTDPGYRSELARAGTERASAFTWGEAADALAAAYRQALR